MLQQQQKYLNINQIPEELLKNKNLIKLISILPSNYNFEIFKIIHRINILSQKLNDKKVNVVLQFPEGLQQFAIMIQNILVQFSQCQQIFIQIDTFFGACCIDDITGSKVADLIVHFGHSCLVPITDCKIPVLYIFVDIQLNYKHLEETIKLNLNPGTYYLMGTVQFINSIYQLKIDNYKFIIPQNKPRINGEVLGCTSPKLEEHDVIFVCDGRFHYESVMIHNPKNKFYQYNPLDRRFTQEKYDFELMKDQRNQALNQSIINIQKGIKDCIIIFGILGRQGN